MRTIKLQIVPISKNKDHKDNIKNRLNQIMYDTRKAANIMINSHYMSTQFMLNSIKLIDFDLNKIYKKKSEEKTNERKLRIEELNKIYKNIYGVTRESVSERNVKLIYDNIPSCVSNSLKNNIKKVWNDDLKGVLSGSRTIRSYKRGMPIPIRAVSMTFKENDIFEWTLGRNEIIEFKIIYGKDKGNYKSTVYKIINGLLKKSISSIQFKKNKFYLNLCVNDIKQKVGLNPDIIVGVDLGIRTPAYIATNEKFNPYKRLGDINDFLRVRLALQNKRKKAQRNAIMSKGGHGKKRKMKAVNRISNIERNFVKTYNHKISKEIIKFALQQNAGVIKLEFLKGFSNDETKDFFLRNWSYFELQQQIQYKAQSLGIDVIFIDPYHTSQTCSKCGHFEYNQRHKELFHCKKCNNKMNADKNAAINIANSNNIVIDEEDCEIKKQENTRKEIFKIFKNTSDIKIDVVNNSINVKTLIAINPFKERIKKIIFI